MKGLHKNQTVIITGASSGVGEAVAHHFAANEANLVLVARNKEKLYQVKDHLRQKTNVIAIPMDVTKFDDCQNLVNSALAKYSSIDILINNAGCHERGYVEENDPQDLGRMIDVNLKAPIVLSRMVLPHMIKDGCAIINVASLAGRVPVPGSAVYSASKFGLRAFTYALSNELHSRSIKIATVSPGPIDTPFIMSDIDSVSDLTFSQKISTVDEVAKTILRLCKNKKIEESMPKLSGFFTNMTYLFPRLGSMLSPFLIKKGHRTKMKLKSEKINR